MAIVSIRHKGLKLLWTKGDGSKLEAKNLDRIEERLDVLDAATALDDIALFPGYGLHELTGDRKGTYSIKVDGNNRMTFQFEDGDVYVLDYEDYH